MILYLNLTTIKHLDMSIANLKSKASSIAQNNSSSISKKIEVFGPKSMPTIISRDLKVEGVIISAGLIEIEGTIKGTIRGNSVILREDGIIEGEIIAESLSLRGQFSGNIQAKNINISSKARINGVIEYNLLSVEDGACIDGQFKKMES